MMKRLVMIWRQHLSHHFDIAFQPAILLFYFASLASLAVNCFFPR